MEKLSILFESGTSKEEIQSFSNNIRQKLEGKVSGKELEDIIKKYNEGLSTLQTMCDSCKNTITKEEKEKLERYAFQCRKCSLKFDLCSLCQKDNDCKKCPSTFGCNEGNVEKEVKEIKNQIFIPKDIPQPFDVWRENNKEKNNEEDKFFCEESLENYNFYITREDLQKELKERSRFGTVLSYIHIREKGISYKFIKDLWNYFQSTDPYYLKKYGEPNHKVEQLPNWYIYQMYQNIFSYCFRAFVNCPGKSSMLRFFYPNNDSFIIRKCYGEEKKFGVPFLTFFLPASEDNRSGWYDKIGLEFFKKKLEKLENFESLKKEYEENGEFLQAVMNSDEELYLRLI